MKKRHVPNTRRHKFVGDVTTIWLCPANQFAGHTETSRGVHVALWLNIWPRWLVRHVLGQKCCTITWDGSL